MRFRYETTEGQVYEGWAESIVVHYDTDGSVLINMENQVPLQLAGRHQPAARWISSFYCERFSLCEDTLR